MIAILFLALIRESQELATRDPRRLNFAMGDLANHEAVYATDEV